MHLPYCISLLTRCRATPELQGYRDTHCSEATRSRTVSFNPNKAGNEPVNALWVSSGPLFVLYGQQMTVSSEVGEPLTAAIQLQTSWTNKLEYSVLFKP